MSGFPRHLRPRFRPRAATCPPPAGRRTVPLLLLLAAMSDPAAGQVLGDFVNATDNHLWSDPENWTGGLPVTSAVIGPGDVVLLQSGDAFTIGELLFNGSSLEGDGSLTLTGSGSSWQAGNLAGTTTGGLLTIASGAALELFGSTKHLSSWKLANQGSVLWSGGELQLGEGASIDNAGSWTTSFDGTLRHTGGAATVFNNTGSFLKSGGVGVTTLATTFNHSGSVTVQAGTLRLDAGGSASGTFLLGSGATLDVSSSYAFADGSEFSGPGTVRFTEGTATFAGEISSAAAFVVAGGTIDLGGSLALSSVTLDSGAVTGAGTLSLTGSGSAWNGGNLNGAGTVVVAEGATFELAPSTAHDFVGSTFRNHGIVSWMGNYLRSGEGGSFVNEAGGVFLDAADSSIHSTGGAFTFFNDGVYHKTGAGHTYIDVPLQNAGLLHVAAGQLNLRGGGSTTGAGTFLTDAGATTAFTGHYTISDGAALTGDGTYRLDGGVLTIDGEIDVPHFLHWDGQLAGTQTFAGGVIDLYHGNWNATALGPSTTIASGATLNLHANNANDFNYRAIINHGTVNWLGNYLRSGHGGSFTNASGGTFNDTADSTIYSHGGLFTFFNQGLYRKLGDGLTQLDAVLDNTGIVHVAEGQLAVRGGGSTSGSGLFLTDAGAVTSFASDYSFPDGAMLTGDGTYRLDAGVLTIDGNIDVTHFVHWGGRLAGTQTFTGGVIDLYHGNWNATALGPSTTIASGATLNLHAHNANDFNYRAIINQGTVNWLGNYLRSGHGGSFTNASGGTFNDTADSTIYSHGGLFTFFNQGLYRKLGDGLTQLDAVLDNTGIVHVAEGQLAVRGGGSTSGSGLFLTDAGAVTSFHADYTIPDGSMLTGDGTYRLDAGILTIDGSIDVTHFVHWDGRLAGTQTFAGGVIDLYYGNWNTAALGPSTTIGAGATLNLHGHNANDFDYRAIINHGTVNWLGNYLRSGHGGSFTNAPDGTFNDTADSTIYSHGGLFTFFNEGLYEKAGSGITWVDVPFVNTGTVAVAAGELRLRGGGSTSGSGRFEAAPGTVLSFESNYTIADGAALAGPGTYRVNGGILTLDGEVAVPAFVFADGQLAGSQTFTTGTIDWYYGNWNAGAVGPTTTIGADAVLNLHGVAAKDFERRAIINHGTVNWLGNYLRSGHGGSFTNAVDGTFVDGASSQISSHGGTFTFANHGLYHKTAPGTSAIHTPFTNHGTVVVSAGTLYFSGSSFSDADGSLILDGGSLTFVEPVSLGSGSTLKGGGSLTGSITTAGTIDLAHNLNELALAGDLTLLETSHLLLAVVGDGEGANAASGVFVSGSVSLGGAFSVTAFEGFMPAPEDTFMVLDGASLAGAFDGIADGDLLWTTDGQWSFTLHYDFDQGSVLLSDFSFTPVPEPSTWALLLLGASALGISGWRRRRP